MKLPTLPLITSASALSPRQSPTWTYTCSALAPPSSFTASTPSPCTAQLSLTKDRYIGVHWAFEARYADGTTAVHAPLRDLAAFGVSDPFYPYLGNNFLERWPGSSSAFTAVHEFEGVCVGGEEPVEWRFYTTSANAACSARDYRFSSGWVAVQGEVVRPERVEGVQMRRVSDGGGFQVQWRPVEGARAYSVIVQYPTGTDEVGDPYLNVRGVRVQVSLLREDVLEEGCILLTKFDQGTEALVDTSVRRQDVARKAVVHVVDERGVWSFANGVEPVVAGW